MSGTFRDGVHPGLFRPPVSPSSSTDYLSSSTFATETSKRKWSRSNGMQTGSFFEDVYMDSAPRNYALAGQLHSPVIGPNLDDADAAMDESMYSDSDYRRALGTKRSRDEAGDESGGPTPLFTQPGPDQSTQSGSWGSFAFSTIGGVVGRVWEFCKAGAFKGFYAGGGTSYKMTSAGISVDETGSNSHQTYHFQGGSQQQQPQNSQPSRDHRFGGRDRARHLHGQVPKRGHYSNSNNQNAGYDSSYDSGASTPTGPAPKRRRHTENGGELGKNWVMIHEPEAETRTPRRMPSSALPSPRHRTQQIPVADRRMSSASSFSTPTTSSPAPLRPASRAAGRPGSRASDANSLRPLQSASAASFASFKAKAPSAPKPPAPSPTPSRIPVKANTSAVLASSAALSTFEQGRRRRHTVVPSSSDPSASSGHRRRGSIASVATSRVNEIDASPSRLDAEARKLAARRQMEERDNDERMSAFNKQLQDMIRQGREALGTTIEVDGSWEDIS
ncbi:uncharacterized protein Triagg1_5187 [Trichoderma aggressivum f. europaeum]|uniref:Uncharacterized protein n=1 Tax=Trichoderma aggressivum f. europaeum TaxID=173218 RepID=A0AAE1IEW3_9HYPO|nr:hypothetical protein Triagg1_5187 [Trichoderma aggressivum f. europaeum]